MSGDVELWAMGMLLFGLGFFGGWAWAALKRERPGWTDVPVVDGFQALETLRRGQQRRRAA